MKKLFGIGAAVLCSLVVLFTGCSSPSAPSTPEPVLDKIEITTEPTKKEYFVGAAALDLAGMKVTAIYSDGNTKDVTTEVTTSGFDSSKAVESQTITVTYGGKTATFTVKIKESQPYSFHDTVTALPSGTTGSYGTDATYVEFGDWPQDVVPVADVAVFGLETSTKKVTRGYMEFVQGLDGNYYVKCEEDAVDSGYKYNKDNSDVGRNKKTSRWFKVMPIKWRVADSAYDVDGNTGTTTGKLLVAENILTGNVLYYAYYKTTDNHRNGTYLNNYMHSQIRAYLNGISYNAEKEFDEGKWLDKGFLQTAFTSDAINKIITTKVDNSKDSTTDKDGKITKATIYACDPTDDKIFLLSEYEVTKYSKEAYNSYGKGNSRIRVTTDFAKANFVNQSTTDGYGGYWWLRSPHYLDSYEAYRIDYKGEADSRNPVDYTGFGVVPALSISF
ncbi:MAG: bacterial Ig-like domain-containing protein [Treponema sp.]|nr:bacterial Ig-like domain-containing protein [Candidatus Treponema merdequi]